MSISVLIPAYNAAGTIEATLESVLRQSLPPDEVIVLLDGCTDETGERIERFKDRITIRRQENHGVAFTRNRLVEMAKGDILAFVDSDDLWHPKYLEVQQALLGNYSEALVSFAGHVTFSGADYAWPEEPETDTATVEWINQVDFFKRYNTTTGLFGSPSYACIRRSAVIRLGPEPFQFNGVEDSFLFYQLSLYGGVVYFKSPLVAYRISAGSLSANRMRLLRDWVSAFEKLEPAFQKSPVKGLRQAFPPAYAAKRRNYAKVLLGAGQTKEARSQLYRAMGYCHQPGCFIKSLAIAAASWLPGSLQPKWPSSVRMPPNVPVRLS